MLMTRAVEFDKLLEILSRWIVTLNEHQIVLRVLLQMDETRARLQEKNEHVKRVAWQRIKVLRGMTRLKQAMIMAGRHQSEDEVGKKEDVHCWIQPDAIIEGFPEITAFLRSNKRTAQFTCFIGCAHAEAFIRAHFRGDPPDTDTDTITTANRSTCGVRRIDDGQWKRKRRYPGDLHPTERHRAVATFGGRGRSTFVVIEKVRPIDSEGSGVCGGGDNCVGGDDGDGRNRRKEWTVDEDELKLLNKLFHGPNMNGSGVKRPFVVMQRPRLTPGAATVVTQGQVQTQAIDRDGDDDDYDDVPLAKRPRS